MIDVVEIEDRIAKCEKILASDPQSQIFAALADAYRKKGDIARAFEICSQGLKIFPEYSSARIVLTKILLARENYEQAGVELERAIEHSGRTRSTDILEAEILIRRGLKSEASAIIDRLSGTDPDDENVKRLMELIDKEETKSIPIDPRWAAPEYQPAAGATPQPRVERRNMSLAQAIGVLKVMPRVMGALAVGKEGLLLEARFDSAHSKEEFAALSKSMYDTIEQGLEKVKIGEAKEVLIETSSSKIWIQKRDKFLLVIYARDDVSMGALKLKIDDLFRGN